MNKSNYTGGSFRFELLDLSQWDWKTAASIFLDVWYWCSRLLVILRHQVIHSLQQRLPLCTSGPNIVARITVAENLVTYWITYGWKRPFWCLDFPWSVAEEKWELLPLWTGRGLHLTRDTNRGLSGWSQSLSVCKAKPGLTIYRANRNQDQDARKGCA